MLISVLRHETDNDRTLSDVKIGDTHVCYGMEDPVREIIGQPIVDWKIWGKTAIPAGKYNMTINWSNRFKRQMIEILKVPGFSGIRIHNGNGPKSTDGCPLVSMTPDFNYNREAMLLLEKYVMDCLVRKEIAEIQFIPYTGVAHNDG